MRTFALDIGNTAVKYGCFEGNELVETASGQTLEQVVAAVRRLRPYHAVLASVAAPTEEWAAMLRQEVSGTVLEFRPAITPLPIRTTYATPHTLGADRLAAAVGAAWLRPGHDTRIGAVGTAIKCDLVEGGHTFTGRLPLVEMPEEVAEPLPLTGDDTISSIRSGVLNGAAAEVNGFIVSYREQYPGLAVVLAGGDAAFFQPRLKGLIFGIPELVLIGLHRILAYNVKL